MEKELRDHFENIDGLITKINTLMTDYKALQAKCERYEAALKDIAMQSKVDEMEANDFVGDIAEGYDAIINVARKALSAGKGEKDGGMPNLTNSILSEDDMKAWEENQKEDQQ